jgi:hypothetical protein
VRLVLTDKDAPADFRQHHQPHELVFQTRGLIGNRLRLLLGETAVVQRAGDPNCGFDFDEGRRKVSGLSMGRRASSRQRYRKICRLKVFIGRMGGTAKK